MAQQPPNRGGNNVPLIRPEQLDTLPLNVTPEQRQQYKQALTQLYSVYDNTPQGSPQHAEAEGKIRSATMRLMQQLSNRGNRPGSGPGGPVGGQQQQQQQRPPQGPGGPANQGQGQQQGGQPGGMGQAMQNQGGPAQGQQPPQQQQAQQPGGPQQQQGQPQMQLSQQGQQEFKSFGQVYPPPQLLAQGEPAITNYRNGFLRKLMQTLQRRDMAKMKGSNLQRQSQNGQPVPPNVTQQLQAIKQEMDKANNEFKALRDQNAAYGQASGQAGAGQGQQVNGGGPGMMQRTNSQQGVNAGQQQGQEQGDVKMNMGGDSQQQQARTSISPTQQQQASFQNQNQGGAPSSGQQQQPNMNAQQPPSATHPQQTPQSATQGQPPQGFPQQQRPSITQQMNQQMQQQNNMGQQPQQNTPTQGMPPQQPPQQQPGHPPQPQRPQALSHQAAISQASSARQDAAAQQQQQQQPPPNQQQPMQNMPNSNLPFNAPPSATNQTPTSGYPQQTLPQQASSSTKFPIPKQLQLDPRTQGPVQGPPSRPTMGGSGMAGMMGQPGVARPGTFVLEGEGDRVLSKSKLQELVRQVTRSTGSTDSSSMLAPDVEESVLDLADDFVDNVITSACRLAKLRGSQALDVRDIQIVLERNYGIRIPGYGLDEVRTVRKFVPAEGWRSKMQAVQAGKVMGGNGGRDA